MAHLDWCSDGWFFGTGTGGFLNIWNFANFGGYGIKQVGDDGENSSNDRSPGENRDDGVVGGIVGGLENLSDLDWFFGTGSGSLLNIWNLST